MTVLNELLGLKRYREDKAEMALARSRLALSEVTKRKEEAQRALVSYQQWSETHEREIYGAVYGRIVRPRDLEHLREDVVMLRVKERALNETLTNVEAERTQADTAVRDSRTAHERATRTREKFVQLVEAQSEEIRVEAERKEDVELEDLYSVTRDREDWEERDDE
ncbi:type III secretion system stalk subunit SctO [Peristeroidobacter soli]|uniref:type III secretion system stalk subunit SctO n=1 Tax=Peristeroidobacter soli TaxID=2497877 RepID=UPI00101D8C9E|nr:YscO family type III secretion system apparatus protein [Peristeroidobacter soli]